MLHHWLALAGYLAATLGLVVWALVAALASAAPVLGLAANTIQQIPGGWQGTLALRPVVGASSPWIEGTLYVASDTQQTFRLYYDGSLYSWVPESAAGGGVVQPATQIVEGTGTGLTSSASHTYNKATGTFTAADQASPPVPILSVTGTSAPLSRTAIVADASNRTIWQVLANNASRSIVWVDEAGKLVMQAATLAASRTVTWFAEDGTTRIVTMTLIAATANVLFGATNANHLVIDVANAKVLGKTGAGVTTFVLDEATGSAVARDRRRERPGLAHAGQRRKRRVDLVR